MVMFTTHGTRFSARWKVCIGGMLAVTLMAPVSALAAPGVPALVSPTNGSLNQPLSLVLNWGSVAAATSYGVQVSTSSSFGTTIFNQTALTAVSAAVSGLSINTIYYWSVNASNGSGTSAWATVSSFTTIVSKLAPVSLGTAGNFAILSKSGITTTGTTSIVGNIGVSPIAAGAITGFGLIMDASGTFSTSSLVDGKAYAADYTSPTPSNLTTAVSNMQTAYTDAAGRPTPDHTELYSGNLTGHTLAAGLYKWSTAVQVDGAGAVTLSGSASDVWIFQIAQDLTMGNGAMVTLTGGAQASNIFWQVAGQVTLGSTSAMKGIILCQTAVVMNDAASMNGKVLAQTAVTLISNPVVSSDSLSVAAPAAPVLASPTNGATGRMPTLTLSWNSVTGAVSYTVQVSTGSTFATTVFNQTGASLTAAATGLNYGAITYYWQASATNAGGTAWSGVWSFTTLIAPIPGVPLLAAPTNGALDNSTSLTLSWGTVSGAATYAFQLSTVSNFSSKALTGTTLVPASISASGLANGTVYYWQANATSAGGTSAWSSMWSFTTIVGAPGAPILVTPTNGSGNQPISLGLSWGSSAGATSYEVQVSLSSAFATTFFDQSGATLTNATVSALANSTVYYWRSNASNIGGKSWSAIWSFTTIIATPAAPVLASPISGATGQASALTLSWNSVTGATSYAVQVSTGSTFANTLFSQSGASLTSAVSGLTYGGVLYYWRASAADAGGATWSSSWSFVTLTVPPAPSLASPTNNAIFTKNTPLTLSWGTVTTATSYTLLVSSTSAFSSTVLLQNGLTASASFTPSHGFPYYWRVSAINAAGTGAWSSVWTLAASVSVMPSRLSNDTYKFSMKQAVIAYSLSKAEQVEISLYDMLGRTAMTLSRRQAAGSYSIDLKGSTLAAGQYVVRFKAGAFERQAFMLMTR